MRMGMLATAFTLMFAPSLAVAADPAIVYQTQPLGRLLDDMRALVQSVGGEEAAKSFNKDIKRSLGDKGFEGFDLNRPIVGYVDVPADPMDAVAVVCFPITGEKEWLEFCERWNKSKPKALKDGIFEVPPPNPQFKAAMRIVEGYAYIATGMKDPARVLDAKTLVPFAKIYDGADVALMAGRIYFDRVPKELRTQAKQGLEQLKKMVAGVGMQPGVEVAFFAKLLLEPSLKLANRYLDLSEGAKDAKLSVNLDAFTGDVAAELTVTPVEGSPLDKVISGMKPSTNRFAGIIGLDAAAGIKLRLPLDIPEVQAAAIAGLEALQKEANNNAFPPMKGIVDELLKGLIRTVKTGEMDGAAVLRGPAKDGTFTASMGIAFDDPSGVEKELKKVIESLAPQEFKDTIKWDADKANGVSIHTFDISKSPGEPREIKAIFGNNVMFAFAFGPKASYAAIGPGAEAVAALKVAMAAKPVPAPAVDFAYNADKILKLATTIEPQGAMLIEKMIGKQDKLISALSWTTTGGKELKVKVNLNVKLFGSGLGVSRSATFEPVQPAK